MSGPTLALAALGLAVALAGPARIPEPIRQPRRRPVEAGSEPRAARLTVASVALGVVIALIVGGLGGLVSGCVLGAAAQRWARRLEPAGARKTREARSSELPLVLDLLAVCLRAGMPLVSALETVGDALRGSFSRDLAVVARLQRLGSAPGAAWSDWERDPDLAPVARAVSRSAESGSRLAMAFDRLAAERRAALAAAGEERARRAGVIAMAPLGLCFLPAFVCLGIVPIVLSLAGEVLP
jgi:pilus assembly protein TadC